MNILIGLIPSVLFATFCLLTGYFKAATRERNVGTSLGFGIGGLVLSPFLASQLTFTHLVVGVICGIMWSSGMIFQLRAYNYFGMSRCLVISTGTQILITALSGVIVFHEWATPISLISGIGAVITVITGIAFSTPRATGSVNAQDLRKGTINSLICGSIFGCYPVLFSIYHVPAFNTIGPMGIGLLLGALGLYFYLPESGEKFINRNTLGVFAAGLVVSVAVFFQFYSIDLNGLATGFALSQMNVALTTIGGILILKEKPPRQEYWKVSLGTALVIGGGFLLALAKAYDLVPV